MKFKLISCFLIILLINSCTNHLNINSDEADKFLNEVLDVMEANSINKYKIDWTDFRTKVFEKAVGIKSIQDTYPAIEEALILLGDNHSSYTTPNGGIIFVGILDCGHKEITSPYRDENIGYVRVEQFAGSSNSSTAISFAQKIQDQIISEDRPELLGWIVDLRNNGGGNMWPMIAGIGPILGEGTAGYFIDPDNNQSSWGYKNGSSVIDDTPQTELRNSYELITPNPKVAILLNHAIGSSGEVMTISFIGRANTKSFGSSTCGLSTANRPFILSDGSKLNLTAAYLADRNKNLYGVPINPDVPVSEIGRAHV